MSIFNVEGTVCEVVHVCIPNSFFSVVMCASHFVLPCKGIRELATAFEIAFQDPLTVFFFF